ncbi:ARM repeat protein interacting with ABF2 [Porphyridium purpureum]|uniref:ARM repeat protein interacting with ABF2 n=1 Tax=Porphyridium purpureum TaxID=35688 RepID=A0A5J4Z7W0_PORPP|nr:ARM repeat protein interacting with ABF2 [Porphyridium purpureum]|eukprot:POR9865..scf295_1
MSASEQSRSGRSAGSPGASPQDEVESAMNGSEDVHDRLVLDSGGSTPVYSAEPALASDTARLQRFSSASSQSGEAALDGAAHNASTASAAARTDRIRRNSRDHTPIAPAHTTASRRPAVNVPAVRVPNTNNAGAVARAVRSRTSDVARGSRDRPPSDLSRDRRGAYRRPAQGISNYAGGTAADAEDVETNRPNTTGALLPHQGHQQPQSQLHRTWASMSESHDSSRRSALSADSVHEEQEEGQVADGNVDAGMDMSMQVSSPRNMQISMNADSPSGIRPMQWSAGTDTRAPGAAADGDAHVLTGGTNARQSILNSSRFATASSAAGPSGGGSGVNHHGGGASGGAMRRSSRPSQSATAVASAPGDDRNRGLSAVGTASGHASMLSLPAHAQNMPDNAAGEANAAGTVAPTEQHTHHRRRSTDEGAEPDREHSRNSAADRSSGEPDGESIAAGGGLRSPDSFERRVTVMDGPTLLEELRRRRLSTAGERGQWIERLQQAHRAFAVARRRPKPQHVYTYREYVWTEAAPAWRACPRASITQDVPGTGSAHGGRAPKRRSVEMGRAGHCMVARGSRIYVFGGVTEIDPRSTSTSNAQSTSTHIHTNTVLMYDLESCAWRVYWSEASHGGGDNEVAGIDLTLNSMVELDHRMQSAATATGVATTSAAAAGPHHGRHHGGGNGIETARAAATGRANMNTQSEYPAAGNAGVPVARPSARPAPVPRRHASMVEFSGHLVVYGGFDAQDNVLGDMWMFSLLTKKWKQVTFSSRTAPAARAEHVAVEHEGKMVVFGGYCGKRKLNDTHIFDFITSEWRKLRSSGASGTGNTPAAMMNQVPSRRCKHSAVLHNGKMYVLGGFQYSHGDNFARTDMYVLDLATETWSAAFMTGQVPVGIQGHKALVCGDSMWVVGGKIRGTAAGSNMHAHDLGLVGADNVNPPHMSGGAGNGAAALNVSSVLNQDAYEYRFDINKWFCVQTSSSAEYGGGGDARGSLLAGSALNASRPEPRQLHSAVSVAAAGPHPQQWSIFVFGGTNRDKNRIYSDMWELHGYNDNYYGCSQTGDTKAPLSVRRRGGAGLWPRAGETCDMCSNFNELYGKPLFSDVTFVVEGKRFPAHRAVLYAKSRYFHNMFSSNMREAGAFQREIEIAGVSARVFEILLKYVYGSQVDWDTQDWRLTAEVMTTCDMYGLDGLREVCEKSVQGSVEVANVAYIVRLAEDYHLEHLKSFCVAYILTNFREVIESDAWRELLANDPTGLPMEILRSFVDGRPAAMLSGGGNSSPVCRFEAERRR